MDKQNRLIVKKIKKKKKKNKVIPIQDIDSGDDTEIDISEQIQVIKEIESHKAYEDEYIQKMIIKLIKTGILDKNDFDIASDDD
jgi:hypothetical protein